MTEQDRPTGDDLDSSRVTEILDGITGAWKSAETSIEQIRNGDTIPLSEL